MLLANISTAESGQMSDGEPTVLNALVHIFVDYGLYIKLIR